MLNEIIEAYKFNQITALAAQEEIIAAIEARQHVNAEALILAERVKQFETAARRAIYAIALESNEVASGVQLVPTREQVGYDTKALDVLRVKLIAEGYGDIAQRIAECSKITTVSGHVKIGKGK